jgi:hypothetical protein
MATLHRMLLFLLLSTTAATGQTPYGTPSQSQGAAKTSPQSMCPWLTQGNAARALGGDASVTVNVANTREGSCRFFRQNELPDMLQIVVSRVNLPACPAESLKLRGIGNEAARCRQPGSHGEAVEMVSSRVRDLRFTVTLTSRKSKSVKASDPQDDALEQVAEQVAGNLY